MPGRATEHPPSSTADVNNDICRLQIEEANHFANRGVEHRCIVVRIGVVDIHNSTRRHPEAIFPKKIVQPLPQRTMRNSVVTVRASQIR